MPELKDMSSFPTLMIASNGLKSKLMILLRPTFRRLAALDQISDIYSRIKIDYPEATKDPLSFVEKALYTVGVDYHVHQEDYLRIPENGSLIVVSNHPYGGLDGLILASLMGKIRRDIKILANYLLRAIPEIQDLLFYVDPFEKNQACIRNVCTVKRSINWVKQGGVLALFPSGEVSSFDVKTGRVNDPVWNPQIARIIRNTSANVLPVFFSGANSKWFQLAGLIHPRMRTLLLPREMIRGAMRKIHVRIGNPISAKRLMKFNNDQDLINSLRFRTYNLRHGSSSYESIPLNFDTKSNSKAEVFRRSNTACLEFEKLPSKQLLMETRDFVVGVAWAEQIPNLMQLIGRYREECFRAAGEGTGKEIDIDLYDNYYRHLILWHKTNREIAGAYRLGEVDVILPRYGIKGLYTHTLFKIDVRLFRQIGPALELGRSFIRREYQKKYAPLLLLWKGIGAFIAQNSRYTSLFGPVSISPTYLEISRQYMVNFLKSKHYLPRLADYVRPLTPFRSKYSLRRDIKKATGVIRHLDDLCALIGDIEPVHKGIPVLLKHYLKIGGNLLGFNVDYAFNGTLDGLILVELPATQPQILSRFMGKELAAVYLQQHGRSLDFQAVVA